MTGDRLLPHDIEAEEAVIGSLLIDGEAISRIGGKLKPEDFYRERNRICYQATITLYERSEPLDQITVSRELAHHQQLEAVGGMAYLSHLVSITPTSVHIEYYAALVVRAATMRNIIAAAADIMLMGYESTVDADDTIRQAEERLYRVRTGERREGFVSLRSIYDRFLEDRANIDFPEGALDMPVLTGFSDLDQLIGGMQRSDMLILGARPGLGKSALAVNLSVNAASGGATIGIFSLEMSGEQLGLRILASEAMIDSHRLRLGLYSDAEEHRIIQAIGELSDLPIYIDDTPFQTMLDIRSNTRRLSLEHGVDLIVVDYLQLVQGADRSGRMGNRVHEISEISRSLKGMARDLHIPVVTCSQLSRVVENRPNHRPLLSDLRDSGSIEQDADIVMFIYRDDFYHTPDQWEQLYPGTQYPRGIAEIILAKHRHGPTGTINLYFRENVVRFESLQPPGAMF